MNTIQQARIMRRKMGGETMISTVYQLVNNMEASYAEKIAIQYYDEAKGGVVSIRYGQYAQDIRRAAGLLLHRDPDIRGRKICLLARNGYDFLVNMFSVLLTGAVLVPLNLQKNWDEIQYELDLVEPAYILHDGEFAAREPALAAAYGDKLLPVDGYKTSAWSDGCAECADRDALSVILFTSGTTGRSKGVMISQRNLFAPMDFYCLPFEDIERQTGWDTSKFRSFSVLPMFHVAALTSSISWAIMGNTINLCNDLKHFYRDLAAMDSEVMAVVPVLLQTIHRDVVRGRRDRLGSLKVLTCGAASMDAGTMSDLVGAGFFICQMYGLTETVGDGAWNNSQDLADLHSVGLRDPKREYKLDDGELCIRGDSVMMGYYKDPAATAEVLDAEGWLHTGDLARIDERGYIFLTGRKKNVIILGSGENVSPEELEAKLNQCPDVTESLIREENGKIGALVWCGETGEAKQAAVQSYVTELNRTLPLYKRIAAVHLAEGPLPRNAAGKLLRK